MRKFKLLFAACALFVGAMTASAQETGTYYIQNVGTGKWLGPGNNWGTRASMLDHADYWKLAKISDGVYTMESVVANSGSNYYLNGNYCDGAAFNWTFTAVSGKENTYVIGIGNEGDCLTAGDKLVNLESDFTKEVAQWKLWSESDMATALSSATASAPVDATFLIKDHDLGRNNRDYNSSWKKTGGATDPKTSDKTVGENSVFSVESYKQVFDFYQTLSNVPNGVYGVRVSGFYRQDGEDTNLPYLYANDEKLTLPVLTGTENNMQTAAVSFVNGKYLSDVLMVQVTDKTLKIGVATTGTSCWAIFKNFHLTYYGANASVDEAKSVAEYQAALDAALAIDQSATMSTEALQNLQNAISDYSSVDPSNSTELQNATAALNAAVAKANASIDASKYFSKMKAVLDLTNVYTQTSYADYYGTWLAQYEAGTLTENLTESMAYSAGWHVNNYIDDILLSSWTIGGEQANAYDKKLYINTWSVEGDYDGSNFKVPFFEYFIEDDKSLPANTLRATVANLDSNGKYRVTMFARVKQTNNQEKVANSIRLTVGDNGQPTDLTAGTQVGSSQLYVINEATAEGVADADGNLTINISIAENSNVHWLSFRDVKYEPAVTLIDVTAAQGYSTYYNTEKAVKAYTPGVTLYTVTEVSDTEATLTELDTAPAGTPLIIDNHSDGEAIQLEEIEVTPTTSLDPVDYDPAFKGAGDETEIGGSDAETYVLNNGQFVWVKNPGNIAAGKCYLDLSGYFEKARSIRLVIGGTTDTGVAAVKKAETGAAVYSLDGRQVANPAKGIYVKDGKKIVIK